MVIFVLLHYDNHRR